MKICLGDLSISKFVPGDFSFYEDVFMKICPLKICLRDFSFCEDVFMEIFPFMKMYLWSFVHLRLK